MRITDQYVWHIILNLFFLVFVFMGVVILDSVGYKAIGSLAVTDYSLVVLASFRLIRLIEYDVITAFFREQFYDAEVLKTKVVLTKPSHGPRRTIIELLLCPWSLGIWTSATVFFFYLLTPYALFPVAILALGGVATMLQLVANFIGGKTGQLKQDGELR